MGAVTFETLAFGETAQEAFSNAVADAKHMHGHGGYTGTIAEKSSFEIIASKSITENSKYDCYFEHRTQNRLEEIVDEQSVFMPQ